MTDEFKLSSVERDSTTWRKIEGYLQQRLEICRRKNDGDLGPDETSRLRGEIASYKRILALGDVPPPVEADDT